MKYFASWKKELLIYYLRDNTQLDKAVLFEWFRQIAGEIRKYQQSRRGQNYRCLTPYSIVVTEEGELLLLNPDAQENEFVIKKMQQKAEVILSARQRQAAGKIVPWICSDMVKYCSFYWHIQSRSRNLAEVKNADWSGSLNVVPVAEDGIMTRSAR